MRMTFAKTCAVCARSFSWREQFRFQRLFWRRRVSPCPECGARLRWTRDSWVLFAVLENLSAALLLAGLLVLVIRAGASGNRWDLWVSGLLLGLSFVLMTVAFLAWLRTQLERIENDAQVGQAR